MRDKLYAPEVLGDDAVDAEGMVWRLAFTVAAHTHHDAREVAEVLFRVVGYMCAEGSDDVGRD